MLHDTLFSYSTARVAEDLEEEVAREVDKVLNEILTGKLVEAPSVPDGSVRGEDIPERQPAAVTATGGDAPDEDWNEVHQRLEALRSD